MSEDLPTQNDVLCAMVFLAGLAGIMAACCKWSSYMHERKERQAGRGVSK